MRLVFAGLSAELAVLGGRSWIGAERGEAGSITGADAQLRARARALTALCGERFQSMASEQVAVLQRGGVTFEITPNISATLNAASTFARDDRNDYRMSAGRSYKF